MRLLMGVLTILICGLVGVGPTNAAEKVSFSISTTAWSKYVGNGGFLFHDGPVIQHSLTGCLNERISFLPKNLCANAWWSAGMDGNFSDDSGDEIDWTAWWFWKYRGINLELGIAHFDIIPLFSNGGPGDVFQPYAEVSKGFELTKAHTIIPFARLEWVLPLRGKTPGGLNPQIGVRHSWVVGPRLTLNQELGFFRDGGSFGAEKGVVVTHYNASFDWKVTKKITLGFPKVKITSPIPSSKPTSDGREPHVAAGASILVNF